MTKWLEKLEAYEAEGFKEIVGKKSNPRIIKWAHGVGKADYMVDDSKTPWCGIGMAGVMDECGLGHVGGEKLGGLRRTVHASRWRACSFQETGRPSHHLH
jgi:hypothetical protein